MRRRSAVAVALLLTVVLAGCTGQLGGGSEGQSGLAGTITPAPVPTVDEFPDDDSKLPLSGITDETFLSASELAREHERALGNTSVRIRERYTLTVTGVEVRNQRVVRTGTVIFEPGGGYQLKQTRTVTYLSGSTTSRNVSVFASESGRYTKVAMGDAVSYAGSEGGVRLIPRNTSILVRQYLAVESATVDRITIRGKPHYLLRGEGIEGDVRSLASNYTVRAIVRPNGAVRRISVSYSEGLMGRDRRIERTIVIEPVGDVSLESPEWLPTAKNRTGSQ